jgi:hypothetical protein
VEYSRRESSLTMGRKPEIEQKVLIIIIELKMRDGSKVSGLIYKSRAKWKILRGIYSAIYGEVNVSVSFCVEIKGVYIEK